MQEEQNLLTAQAQSRLADMSSLLKIKPFKGLADGSEDPEEFLDAVQAVAEGWHMARPADAESFAALRTTMMRFFR